MLKADETNRGDRPNRPINSFPRPCSVPGTVLSIGDGDTITINQNGEKVKVRLGWIDAPEMKQAPYGEAARNQLKSLLPIGIPITVREIDCNRPKP